MMDKVDKEMKAIWRKILGFRNQRELRAFLKRSTAEEAAEWFNGFIDRYNADMNATFADIREIMTRNADHEYHIHKMLGGKIH